MHVARFGKSATVVRPSKRVEVWENVADVETAIERVHYWAKYFTKQGFGKRFGFSYERSKAGGFDVTLLDRSIADAKSNQK